MDVSLRKLAATLPAGLRERFSILERRLFRVETATLGLSVFTVVGGGYLMLFASDRGWDSAIWFRSLIFATGAALMARAAWGWAGRWVWRRRDLRDLAMMVQKRFRRLGDRLLGIVELADETRRPPEFSAELYRAAIHQVADQAAPFDFAEAVDTRVFRRAVLVAASLAVVSLFTFAVVPAVGLNSLARLALPWKHIPRLTLVELTDLPPEMIVPHGETFPLKGRVQYRTALWRPKTVRFQAGGLGGSALSSGGETWSFQAPALLNSTPLRVRLGDAEAVVQIKPTLRPALNSVTATFTHPDYLGYPVATQNIQGSTFSAVIGGKVIFKASATRALDSAHFFPAEGAGVPMAVNGADFTSPMFELREVAEGAFGWRDRLGLSNAAPWPITVQPKPDLAPVPELVDFPSDLMLLESEVLPIKVAAQDDFGVKQIGLLWETPGGASTNAAGSDRFSTESTNRLQPKLESVYAFTPALVGAGADTTLIVRAFAVDYFPGRKLTLSAPKRIQIVGNEQHAEAVRQRLESLLSHLEEVARGEEKIALDTAELKNNPALEEAAAAKKAGEIQQAQEQIASQLQSMSEEGMKTLREAMRNPAFSEQALAEWSKTLREMQDVSRQSMSAASKKLGQASKASKAQRSQDLAEAQEKEAEALQDLQQLQKKVNKGLDNLQALTLAQRLKKVGGREAELGQSLLSGIQETIGLPLSELNSRQTKALSFAAEEQSETHRETTTLSTELSRFFERTQKENYGRVSKEIKESRAAEELDRIQGLIRENVAMEAMQNLSAWSEKFTAWADILEPPRKKGGDAGGGGGGAPGDSQPDTAMQTLIELLRLRESQVNVQQRTRLLDEQKSEATLYQRASKRVAQSQDEIKHRVGFLSDGNPFQILKEPLASTESQTASATDLLRQPETGAPTQKFQGEAVALLSDAINLLNEQQQKESQQKGGGSSESDEMAMLMKLMAQQPGAGMGTAPGQQAGGNMSGGDTADRARAITGNVAGKSAEARAVNKASGRTLAVPTEFREALDEFYKAVEQEPN